MYTATVILFMFVLPVLSILAEVFFFKNTAGIPLLAGKWFVFWAMGVRLFSAGLRQASNPRFTVEKILGLKGVDQFIVVQELGFANITLGLAGLLSILNGNWTFPIALTGCLFFALAGVRHIFSKERNPLENIAMVSNLFVCGVLLFYILTVFIR